VLEVPKVLRSVDRFGHKADILSALTGESWWLAPGFYQDDSKLSLASQRAGGFSTKGGRGATETNRFWLTTPIRLLITPHWAETSCRSTPGADPVQKGLQACLQELSLSGVHDAESRHELSLQPAEGFSLALLWCTASARISHQVLPMTAQAAFG
jgi:hypothetical protein